MRGRVLALSLALAWLGCESDGSKLTDGPAGTSDAQAAGGTDAAADAGAPTDAAPKDAAAAMDVPVDASASDAPPKDAAGADAAVADAPPPDVAVDAPPPDAPAPPSFGLDTRPGPQACKAPARPTGAVGDPFPATIKATGCFDPADPSKPAAGLIPYAVNVDLWSDGADKLRWMAVPDGAKITIKADGDWDFPVGSVLLKVFRLGGKPFETRLFVRHSDGEWAGYTYEWNAQGTDGTLVDELGKKKMIGTNNWAYPARVDCMACHTKAAGGTLGLETAQLNRDFGYPGGRTANQLETLDHIGMFAAALGARASTLPALAPVAQASASLETRARAYLHANCANCHRPMGLAAFPNSQTVSIDMRFTTSFAGTGLCNGIPDKKNAGPPDHRLIMPGVPDKSIVVTRMNERGGFLGMPPLGGELVDATGVKLISDWITALPATCP
jgi:uncharacterized repeat protein (TIGR03806 family)